MRTRIVFVLAFFLAVLFFYLDVPLQAQNDQDVHAFYYIWYRTPAADPEWGWKHWLDPGETNHLDIESCFYPRLKGSSTNYYPYSSTENDVIDSHMEWLKDAGVGVIIISWRPDYVRRYTTKADVQKIMDIAADKGMKACFAIDQYSGRTLSAIISHIIEINTDYYYHPAFYKVRRPTKYGNPTTTAERGVFYVWASRDYPVENAAPEFLWGNALDSIRNGPYDSIVLDHIADPTDYSFTRLQKGHFDGQYIYRPSRGNDDFVNPSEPDNDHTKKVTVDHGSIFSIGVAPGFNTMCTREGEEAEYKSRENGIRYNAQWQNAVDSFATWAAVVTFNEWHEGTQIEPATYLPPDIVRENSCDKYNAYCTYEQAYGRYGQDSEMAYMDRTADWSPLFSNSRKSLPLTPTLKYPANGSLTKITPTCEWEAINSNPPVDKYKIKIKRVSDDVLVYVNTDIPAESNPEFTIPKGVLENGVEYKWRIRAHNELGWGANSEYWTFTASNYVYVKLQNQDFEYGLQRPDSEPSDGKTISAKDNNNEWLRKNRGETTNPISKYIYFQVNDNFIYEGNWNKGGYWSAVKITVEYWNHYSFGNPDLDNEKRFKIQYDSTNDPNKSTGYVQITGGNAKESATFFLNDVYFGNRKNKDSDFRIWCGSGDAERFDRRYIYSVKVELID